MHAELPVSYQSALLHRSSPWLNTYRFEDPNPLNYPDEEEDVPMPPDDPARKAPIDEPPSPSIPKRAQA